MSGKKYINFARWSDAHSGLVFLTRDLTLSAQAQVPLSIKDGEEIKSSISRLGLVEYGKIAGYFINKGYGYFVFPSAEELSPGERVYVAGTFNDWKGRNKKKWLLEPMELDGVNFLGCAFPLNELVVEGQAYFKFVTSEGRWLGVSFEAPNRHITEDSTVNFYLSEKRTGRHVYHFNLEEGYRPSGNEIVQLALRNGKYAESPIKGASQAFLQLSTNKKLGSWVERDHTFFRVFTPRANKVQLLIFVGEEKTKKYTMRENTDGTWEFDIPGNQHGLRYYYFISGDNFDGTTYFDDNVAIVDPWAKACDGNRGPAVVIDESRLPSVDDHFTPADWHDLVICESHVRDVLAQAPLTLTDQERRSFAGLAKYVREEDNYFTELGVNAVELQPVQQNDSETLEEYHWGYMTTNYFSIHDGYGTNPQRMSQIEEFADAVRAFHERGIAVILDVVYNHVGEPNFLYYIDKYYYFELSEKEHLMNFSGCGNDLRCGTPVAKRLIIESLSYLINTFNVDGFRFDLAELIGKEVLLEIQQELKAIKPSLILICEPWSFRGHIIQQMRDTAYTSWNDGYRDFLPSYVRGEGNFDAIKYFIGGSHSHASWPAQTVNYTESHDDYCWIDRITQNLGHNGSFPTTLDRRRTHLMFAVLLSSLGIPMLSAGQDMMRSKEGIHNTYQRGDLNVINYSRSLDYPQTAAYVRSWIQFRLSEEGQVFRLSRFPEEGFIKAYAAEGSSAILIEYNADRSMNIPAVRFAVNPHHEKAQFSAEDLYQDCFVQIGDSERFMLDGLTSPTLPCHRDFTLPPYSCALWVSR